MRNLILILRKVRREVGTNLIYVAWCAMKVIFNSIKPSPHALRAALKQDHQTLMGRIQNAEALLDQAKFYTVTPSDRATGLFEGLESNLVINNPKSDKPWQRTVYQLAELATMTWDEVDDPAAYVKFLNDQDASFFRYYPLNKGKNDYWEWYLVPWHGLGPL